MKRKQKLSSKRVAWSPPSRGITEDLRPSYIKDKRMFKFLLVMFLIDPQGNIGTVKAPMPSYEVCKQQGIILLDNATKAGLVAIGTCVKPGDYVASSEEHTSELQSLMR